VPTLAEGETLADVRAESFDAETAARRGMAFEALDQLALEHLYGIA
jgi:xylose isomerase